MLVILILESNIKIDEMQGLIDARKNKLIQKLIQLIRICEEHGKNIIINIYLFAIHFQNETTGDLLLVVSGQ